MAMARAQISALCLHEPPEGGMLTGISEPYGRRFAGDFPGFKALLRAKADALTGIKRAGGATVNRYSIPRPSHHRTSSG